MPSAAGSRISCRYGEFPDGDITDLDKLYFPRGIILDKDLSRVHPFDPANRYRNSSTARGTNTRTGTTAGLHPFDGETKAKYTGPPTPWTYLQGETKYTWMKAPRYDGLPMQVGPLARMLVGYASGHPEIQEMVKEVLDKLQVGPAVLFSTLGRTAARGIETRAAGRGR